jgi:DNA-binding CsgD family transcriptional regulator/tetratricopeptide (TPR) repeat protein
MHLLERHRQLEELSRCLREARCGCGTLVLLAGEAGLGKSSLVERFMSENRRDVRTLWGACDALSTPRALAPVREIAAQCSALGGVLTPDPDSPELLFRALLEDLARPERVSIIVLEDLHWADAATLDFVRFLGRRIQRTGAVFIATYREDELSATHPVRLALGELTGDQVIRLRLAPLSPAAVQVLAGESGRDAARLHEVTGGNPFFVREVLASPAESVPQTVRDAVMARLLRCSGATRELAELVAISPGRTEAWLIETVLGPRQAAADEAGARGLLEVHTDLIGFRHELARLAVLETLPPERARLLHRQVLGALVARGADPARLVHHATLAEEDGLVLEYAPRAAREAARLGAHREAAAHLAAALRSGRALPLTRRAELLEQHAVESSVANQTREAIASGTAAIGCWRELGDAEAQARMLRLLAQEYRTIGDRVGADECVARAIALLEAQPRGAQLAMAYGARALLATHRGWDREALEFGQRALELAREAGDRAAEAFALCHIGGAMLGRDDRGGFEPLERSLALALEHGFEDHAARAWRTLQFYASLVHDIARAKEAFRLGVDYCEERGIFSHSAYIRAYYTTCELDCGNWTEAARMADELLRGAGFAGVTQRVTAMATIAVVRVRRGDPGATELLEQALALALPTGELNRIGRVAAARAELAWYEGRLADVAAAASLGLEHVREHTAPWINGELLYWLSRVQRVSPEYGAVAEPYRYMLAGDWQAAARAWERIGMPYEQALSLIEGPEEALRRALAILEQLGAGPLAAIARRRLRELGARSIPRGPNQGTRANPAGLTARELEVLRLLAQGCTNAQLARRLHRSPRTIEHHVGALLEKLGVHSRAAAVAAAYARGVIGEGRRVN